MSDLHRVLYANPLTAWACRIIGCDTRTTPSACVLLLVSVVMTILAILLTWTVG